jgi:hypothetical protein
MGLLLFANIPTTTVKFGSRGGRKTMGYVIGTRAKILNICSSHCVGLNKIRENTEVSYSYILSSIT